MFNKNSKKREGPAPTILPGGETFQIVCRVEETDQFQADFLGEYGDMVYERAHNLRTTIIAVAVCAVLAVLVLVSKTLINEAALVFVIFGAFYLLYGLYHYYRGYRNNYVKFQQHLERAVDKGIRIYEDQTITYRFQEEAVYLEYENGVTRYFLYEDIRYFEETDRFYLFGMKYRPKEARLAGFERALITKRYLDEETEEKLLQVMANVVEAYDLHPLLEDHPFK